MATLFDTDNTAAGYRLHYLEVFNWGTFDAEERGKVWRLEPQGKHSLLTGGNGSGKTTLVDALVTLLVPNSRFHYNQSSESGSKRERDEQSYVRGAHGSLQEEGYSSAQTQYLRKDNDYSVILAHFYNDGKKQSLSLAQVRWYSAGGLQKEFLIAHQALTVADHFRGVEPKGNWKKALKVQLPKSQWFGNNFRQYSRTFMDHFGLRGPQALNLFAKTTGVKVISDLNEFIRQHMLEPPGLEEKFAELRNNYHNLRSIYQEIEKASEQLRLLEPVMESGKDYQQLEKELEELQWAKGLLPYWYAMTLSEILGVAITTKNHVEQQLEEEVQLGRERLEELIEKASRLSSAIDRDEATQLIREIDVQLEQLKGEEGRRRETNARYTQWARELGLPHQLEANDQALFQENRKQAEGKVEEVDRRLARIQEEEEIVVAQRAKIAEELSSREADLRHLQDSQTNIPAHLTQVRHRLANHLQIAESELPFLGELLQVKPEHQKWLSATERALRPLAQHLLIDEKHYTTVNHYVYDQHLEGYIRYLRAVPNDETMADRKPLKHSLIHKLDFLPDHVLCPWLYNYLLKHADFACLNDVLDWQTHKGPVLLRNGMLRQNAKSSHQRDERPEVLSPANYLLGWDIEDKILAVEEEIRMLKPKVSRLAEEIEQLRKQRKHKQDLQGTAHRLLEIARFESINWKAMRLRMEGIGQERARLLENSSLKALQAELEQAKQQRHDQQQQLRSQEAALNNAKRDLEEFQKRLTDCQTTLSLHTYAHVQDSDLLRFSKRFSHQNITLNTINTVQGDERRALEDAEEIAQKKLNKATELLTKRMNRFANPETKLKEQFPSWASQTDDLGTGASDFAQYQKFHKKLEADDLPRYREQFAQELNGQVVDDVILFEDILHSTRNVIKKQIDRLNTSLAPLEYSANTYIMLVAQDTHDSDIQSFRSMLRGVIEQHAKDKLQVAPDYRQTFDLIRELIDKLTEEERWRQRVIDVRNWWIFSAHEKNRRNDETERVYQDSGGLSAGQKAKLAYTILASALAFQFNISTQHVQENSLRFVVVDEAFSKVDEDNATYAMKLFEALSLQVMIVTPLDKIHVVEHMIHSVHYVQNKSGKRSQVFNLTMDEYDEEKTKWKGTGKTDMPPNDA